MYRAKSNESTLLGYCTVAQEDVWISRVFALLALSSVISYFIRFVQIVKERGLFWSWR